MLWGRHWIGGISYVKITMSLLLGPTIRKERRRLRGRKDRFWILTKFHFHCVITRLCCVSIGRFIFSKGLNKSKIIVFILKDDLTILETYETFMGPPHQKKSRWNFKYISNKEGRRRRGEKRPHPYWFRGALPWLLIMMMVTSTHGKLLINWPTTAFSQQIIQK